MDMKRNAAGMPTEEVKIAQGQEIWITLTKYHWKFLLASVIFEEFYIHHIQIWSYYLYEKHLQHYKTLSHIINRKMNSVKFMANRELEEA